MEDLLSDIDMSPALAKNSSRWLAAFIDYAMYLIAWNNKKQKRVGDLIGKTVVVDAS